MILVTGASGVVGTHVVRALLAKGVDAAGFDVLPSRAAAPVGAGSYRFFRGDVRDLASLLDVMRGTGIRRVIHLAGMLGEACSTWPVEALEVNVRGTLNVFEAARLAGVERIVFASTRTVLPDFEGTVHGYPTHQPVAEDVAPLPRRPYEVMKYANERLGLFYRDRHDLETVALRFAMMYAPQRARALAAAESDPSGFAGRSSAPLHRMIWTAAFGGQVAVAGGERLLDLAYVKDIAHGITLACLAEGATSPLYHLGSGGVCSVAAIAATLCDLESAAWISASPGTDFGVGHYCLLDIDRARRELGYAPQFTLQTGMRDCIDEIRQAA